jgi:predicted nucleotidyltransferase
MSRRPVPQKVIQAIQQYLAALHQEQLPIDQVWLFGSYAKGTQHRWSDIDLCVISPRFRNAFAATQYLWSKRLHDAGLTIEPVGFTQHDFAEPSSLTAEIKRTGIKIPLRQSKTSA